MAAPPGGSAGAKRLKTGEGPPLLPSRSYLLRLFSQGDAHGPEARLELGDIHPAIFVEVQLPEEISVPGVAIPVAVAGGRRQDEASQQLEHGGGWRGRAVSGSGTVAPQASAGLGADGRHRQRPQLPEEEPARTRLSGEGEERPQGAPRPPSSLSPLRRERRR